MASLAKGNVTTTGTNVYTSTGNTVITFLSLCNYTASNVTANVYVVPSGDTADNTNIVVGNLLIPAGDTYQLYQGNEKLILSNGDLIFINANANTAITTMTSYTSA